MLGETGRKVNYTASTELFGSGNPFLYFSVQHILHKRPLVGGKALPASEEIEESVAVFDEGRREFFGCFSNLKSASMRGIAAARAVNEKDSGRWSRSDRSPEVAFKAQIATRNHNDLRSD